MYTISPQPLPVHLRVRKKEDSKQIRPNLKLTSSIRTTLRTDVENRQETLGGKGFRVQSSAAGRVGLPPEGSLFGSEKLMGA